ncbi:hypothetical protein ACFU5D_16865 [Streptomyces anthocyanicus]|uniref:hypothetical protein n=1 Tax=Streptomyces anthocyanicus TaxID=68174 RepID=UPI003677A367
MPDQTTDPCPTPETHNWGCGCPSDVAAAIASCPGRELSPSPCRCPCYGCKHHCGAHNPETVPPVVQSPIREQLLNAIDATFCQSLGFGTPEGLLAAYEASRTQTVDQTALERAARRLASRDWLVDETDDDDWQRRGPEFRADYMAWAREVLAAVLPATTNHDTDTSGFELRGDTEIRAAALREAIALLDQRASSIDAFSSSDFGEEARAVRELTDVANELRRVADETAATETQARDCPACDAGIGHSEHCPTPETHKWGCGCHAETQPPAALSPAERTMLGYALDQAQERIWSEDGFTAEDQAAVDSLRRLTTVQPVVGARQDGAQP